MTLFFIVKGGSWFMIVSWWLTVAQHIFFHFVACASTQLLRNWQWLICGLDYMLSKVSDEYQDKLQPCKPCFIAMNAERFPSKCWVKSEDQHFQKWFP